MVWVRVRVARVWVRIRWAYGIGIHHFANVATVPIETQTGLMGLSPDSIMTLCVKVTCLRPLHQYQCTWFVYIPCSVLDAINSTFVVDEYNLYYLYQFKFYTHIYNTYMYEILNVCGIFLCKNFKDKFQNVWNVPVFHLKTEKTLEKSTRPSPTRPASLPPTTHWPNQTRPNPTMTQTFPTQPE